MAEDVPLSSPPPLIPFLPDEISVLCIARVPVTSHTAIAQVSRSWRSFVRSPSFFSLRSKIAVTELVLTVCIYDLSSEGGRPRWYHLHPYQIPFPLLLPQDYKGALACASIGPHLFCIGGNSSHDSLQIYDGCLRRWSHGPSTSAPCYLNSAVVAGGRLHVIHEYYHSLMVESLDPTGTRWDTVPPIPDHIAGNCYWWSSDGKILAVGSDGGQEFGAIFDPDAAEWARAPPSVDNLLPLKWQTVVGGVPYMFRNTMDGKDEIVGYGSDGQWRTVEGESVTELINRVTAHHDDDDVVRLLTFGDLLCLVGEKSEWVDESILRDIIFAGIDISRTADGGFRGSVMWLDSLLKHSEEEHLHHCVVMEL